MLGSTPPWAIVTPESSLFSSSSFLNMWINSNERGIRDRTIQRIAKRVIPDGELEVPGDDAGLLVVPGGVPGQLEDLGGEVLHDSGHVDRGPRAHPLGVVSLPAINKIKYFSRQGSNSPLT